MENSEAIMNAEKPSKPAKAKRNRRISVLNWMGTLILCGIPGVNIIALLLFAILAKNSSKRTFAIAALLLSLLAALLVCALFVLLPVPLSRLAAAMRGGDAVEALMTISG